MVTREPEVVNHSAHVNQRVRESGSEPLGARFEPLWFSLVTRERVCVTYVSLVWTVPEKSHYPMGQMCGCPGDSRDTSDKRRLASL